jgi:hypothetical protein
LETGEGTGFLPHKPNVERPRTDVFSGIQLVAAKQNKTKQKNRRKSLKANIA